MYEVRIKPKAEKFIEKQIPKIRRQLINRLEALSKNPLPNNCKLLRTKEKIYRIDSGNYRIIYQI